MINLSNDWQFNDLFVSITMTDCILIQVLTFDLIPRINIIADISLDEGKTKLYRKGRCQYTINLGAYDSKINIL